MDINAVGVSFHQNSVDGNTKDVTKQIETLEKKKAKLEQDMEKEGSPFALKQSKEYEALKKRIEEIDKQIQQLRALENNANSGVSEVSSSENSNNEKSNNGLNVKGQFDEFINSKDQPEQPSAGIYSISYESCYIF